MIKKIKENVLNIVIALFLLLIPLLHIIYVSPHIAKWIFTSILGNELYIVTEGEYIGRGGLCVSSYLFDVKMTLNVPCTDEEWDRDWNSKKQTTNWQGHMRYYYGLGRPRNWITVWNWQVKEVDKLKEVSRYKQEYIP